MKHPAPERIALFSGGDLGRWDRFRVGRHIARCSECRREFDALRDASSQLRKLANEMSDLPGTLSWNRLAEEMTGNIRVGLAAGEAIARFDKPLRVKSPLGLPRLVNVALVVLGASAVFAVAFWTSLPPQQAEHLMASLNRIRTDRIGTFIHSANPTATSPATREDVVLEASSSGIQVRENGRAMSLIPQSEGATVSVSMHGSAGVRFVDADTGQVTTNKVYYAEQ